MNLIQRFTSGFSLLMFTQGFLACPSAMAVARDSESEKIAADLANPLAPITTLTVQERVDFGNGPSNNVNVQTRLQPSVFKPLSAKEAFLMRSIFPVRFNKWPTDEAGLGDITLVPYFVPDITQTTFAGYGAALTIPTATAQALGSGKWSGGPAALVAVTGQPITWGGLVQQVWSFAGSNNRGDVNVSTVQPFFTCVLKKGWAVAINSESTYNWLASSDPWTIPVTVGVSKVVNFSGRYVNFSVAPVYYAERPDYAPRGELRLNAVYVFR